MKKHTESLLGMLSCHAVVDVFLLGRNVHMRRWKADGRCAERRASLENAAGKDRLSVRLSSHDLVAQVRDLASAPPWVIAEVWLHP